jgi:hypothetical protein
MGSGFICRFRHIEFLVHQLYVFKQLHVISLQVTIDGQFVFARGIFIFNNLMHSGDGGGGAHNGQTDHPGRGQQEKYTVGDQAIY